MLCIDDKRVVRFDSKQFILSTYNDGFNPFDKDQRPSKQTYHTNVDTLVASLKRDVTGELISENNYNDLEAVVYESLSRILNGLKKAEEHQ